MGGILLLLGFEACGYVLVDGLFRRGTASCACGWG